MQQTIEIDGLERQFLVAAANGDASANKSIQMFLERAHDADATIHITAELDN